MGEITKFVYVMIIYLFMFTMATSKVTVCDSNHDCRSYFCGPHKFSMCVRKFCQCI
ncbi:late nodulin [Medicago truncatula]|uniref:Late nodulin n=1 Tax=Medicago truncatula TaxID=3880 RepID=G8A2R7_MEDTR|nr:late nodulin [Medicago truncatula]